MNDLDNATTLTERARTLAGRVVTSSRRGVLCGAFGVSAAAVLAACGTGGDSADTGDSDDDKTDEATSKDSTGDDSGGDALAAEADVPVGGGTIVDDLVVVQPEQGEFLAFERACTHKGVQIEAPKDGIMSCPAHGSKFNVDGTVANGPAAKPLAEVKVTVKDGQIFRA